MMLAYIITSIFLEAQQLRRIWLVAFVIMFVVTSVALSFWRFTNQEVMMNVLAVSWYYILYLSVSVLIVLGVVNLWIFRHQIWNVLMSDDDI